MTYKRCKNCDTYNHQDKFCYIKWEHMDTLEYCNKFKIKERYYD